MKKIYKFGIAILMLMIFGKCNSSIVYATHQSWCNVTTDVRQEYVFSANTTHNVRTYCNNCDGYLYQSPSSCNISSGDCQTEKKCSLCKHSFGYGDHNYQNNWYCNGKKCSVCSATTGYTSHNYGSWSNYSDTQHLRRCSRSGCRNSYDYEDHSYGDWEVTKTSTCEEKGTRKRTCSVCGHVETERLALVQHDYVEKQKSAATCTAPAVYYEECSWCKAQTPTYSKGDKLGHNFTGSYSHYNANQHRRKCSRCSEYEYKDHSYSNNGDCNGKKCSACGNTTGTTTHAWGNWTYANGNQHKRTCSNGGCRTGTGYGDHTGGTAHCMAPATCTTCNSGYGAINSNNHDYTKPCPTCGSSNVICSRNDSHEKTHTCDITGPTVKVSNVTYPASVEMMLQDTQSGIRYWAVTTNKTAPTEKGTSNVSERK